ncbi:hypothetical protein AAFF_G00078880 [Aldrovandia affinis]|uniref:Uncharacterized protein n=1 Tax=Aldrovandia affinis TaxID=143900 RepID=A0AAD7WCK3_9TELE|nr:hypothetical protein AAFF_G00078880 [Aldrovandia affinis]
MTPHSPIGTHRWHTDDCLRRSTGRKEMDDIYAANGENIGTINTLSPTGSHLTRHSPPIVTRTASVYPSTSKPTFVKHLGPALKLERVASDLRAGRELNVTPAVPKRG